MASQSDEKSDRLPSEIRTAVAYSWRLGPVKPPRPTSTHASKHGRQ